MDNCAVVMEGIWEGITVPLKLAADVQVEQENF